jgi:protein-tyrosine phosphatase
VNGGGVATLATVAPRQGGEPVTVEREWTRRLDWEGVLNARDLGGYPAAGGRETRWGALVRSDSLALLTQAGREALVGYGVRTIVDLRLPEEVAGEPNPFAEPDHRGIAYCNLSFIDPAAAPPAEVTTLAEDYKGMLDRYGRAVAEVMAAIADAGDGGVLVHCAAGKDRTGLISALLLGLLGVAPETIADDYALSAECLRPRDEEWLANGPGERADREQALVRFAPTRQVMLEVLDHLDQRYGGVEGYLLQAGVSAEDLDRLRARLLSPAGQEAEPRRRRGS